MVYWLQEGLGGEIHAIDLLLLLNTKSFIQGASLQSNKLENGGERGKRNLGSSRVLGSTEESASRSRSQREDKKLKE